MYATLIARIKDATILAIPYCQPSTEKLNIIIYGLNKGAAIMNVNNVCKLILFFSVLNNGITVHAQTGNNDAYKNADIGFLGKIPPNFEKYFSIIIIFLNI